MTSIKRARTWVNIVSPASCYIDPRCTIWDPLPEIRRF